MPPTRARALLLAGSPASSGPLKCCTARPVLLSVLKLLKLQHQTFAHPHSPTPQQESSDPTANDAALAAALAEVYACARVCWLRCLGDARIVAALGGFA